MRENLQAPPNADGSLPTDGLGPVRRGVADKLLGRKGDGSFDLDNLGSRLERTPEGYRDELFGPDHQTLRGIAEDTERNRPFKDAAFTSNPEKLVQGFGPQTAAGVRQMREIR